MRDLISFLTQLPVGKRDIKIEVITARSFLFPVVGLMIGLLVAIVAFSTFGYARVPPNIAALLTLLALYLLTGLIHLDGLADFFDGLMAPGSKLEKVKAMKDRNLGTAGMFATLVLLLLSLGAIERIGMDLTPPASFDSFYPFASVFVIAEISAKLSMNTCMLLGRSTSGHEGLGYRFIHAFSPRKYLAALLLAFLIAFLVTFSVRFLTVLTGVIVAFIVSSIARKKLGLISGDIMGASNELARCATLLLYALLQTGS